MALGIFPKGDFPSDNFPTVQFPKRQLLQGYVRPSEAPQAACNRGRALRLGWAREPSTVARIDLEAAAWEMTNFGSFYLGK